MPTTSPEVKVDVVIIGGGLQGLFLLDKLVAERYSVVLLEKHVLGGDQSGHAQAFLHAGHLYANNASRKSTQQQAVEAAKGLAAARALWRPYLAATHPTDLFIGLRNSFGNFDGNCTAAQLNSLIAGLPDPYAPRIPLSVVRKVENCRYLNTPVLVDSFSKSLSDCISLCDRIAWSDVAPRVLEVLRSGQSLRISYQAIVFAAGCGNEALLRDRALTTPVQTTTHTYMLALRDLKGTLPADASILLQGNPRLFLVPRQDTDGRTVLLISDVAKCSDLSNSSRKDWLDKVWQNFRQLLPTHQPSDFEWSVYPATKAEGPVSSTYYFHKDSLHPLWVVWPTLLTFAPKAASDIATELPAQAAPSLTSQRQWAAFRTMPEVGKEKWPGSFLDYGTFQSSTGIVAV